MKCELCGERGEQHRVLSDVGVCPTMVGMCEKCHTKYRNGASIEAIIQKL